MRLGVLTTGRQDWGILRSTCLAIRTQPEFELRLVAGGMHMSPRFGSTISVLEADGFAPDATFAFLRDDVPQTVAEEAGEVMRLLEPALAQQRLDALLLVGDRYETLAAAMTATLARVPVVHLHGGEETEGAFDNSFRHAITKLSHLHLVSHPDHAARVIALGENPASVHVVGAPGLDNVHRDDLPDRAELARELGLPLPSPLVVVTLHPTTLGDDPAREAAAVTHAMDAVPATYVVTLPNSDPGNEVTRAALRAATSGRPRRIAVDALGDRRYWGLMRAADAMLGNSSSALIEAPVLALPAVNVGIRQRGRLRGDNVIDAAAEAAAVTTSLRRALDPSFRRSIGNAGPFGDGRSAERIANILRKWTPPRPPKKPPVMIPQTEVKT
jgi:UDP-N-acetylglucosamine 2-epimerase (non-hydrolysing)